MITDSGLTLDPWPAVDEKFFVADLPDGPYNNACLADLGAGWRRYAEGYRCGANLMVQHVNETGRDQDFLVIPIVFCYRQCLELQMKDVIRQGSLLLDLNQGFKLSHNLVGLWRACRSILEQIAPEVPVEQWDAMAEGIGQLAAIDPLSEAFRYPEDKQGGPSLSADAPQMFNLRHFGEQMEKLGNLLGAASDYISVSLDEKHEMQYEVQRYHDPGPER